MAEPTEPRIDDPDSVIGEIAVPDKASLGWSPADYVIVQLEGPDPAETFFSPADDSTGSYTVFGIAADGGLLADVDDQDMESFDLNELLDAATAEAELSFAGSAEKTIIPGDGPEGAFAPGDVPQGPGGVDVTPFTIDLANLQLTFVVDDGSGSDPVAI